MKEHKECYNLFIGRWCPFHNGHKYIIDSFVGNGKNVAIGVRDSEEKYSSKDRKKFIESCYKNEIKNKQVRVFIMPDISTVAVGRKVGYSIIEVPDSIKTISGTKIRKGECNDIPKSVKKIMDKIDANKS